ncbi:MAG TPA: hypothetical protein VFZ70_08850 [Euzebyales bacterium]
MTVPDHDADRARVDRAHVDRAPRLRPDQHLADSITRVGRFAKIDPLDGRDLPRLIRVVGVLGWAALTAESFRRAWAARSRTE